MNQVDWQPVVASIAVFIGIIAPATAALIVSLSNHFKLDSVKAQTDGQLTSLRAEIAALRIAAGETPAPAVEREKK
jgi:hypothetical protein